MHKLISFFLFTFFVTAQLHSQARLGEFFASIRENGTRLMITGGYNLSTPSFYLNDQEHSIEPDHGFNVGLMGTARTDKTSLEAGLLVSTSGGTFQEIGSVALWDTNGDALISDYSLEQKNRTYNFIVPVLISHHYGPEQAQFYFSYGVYLGVGVEAILRTKVEYTDIYLTGEEFTGSINEKFDLTEEANAFDFGLSVGAGVKLNRKTRLGATFNFGFGDQAAWGIGDFNYNHYYLSGMKIKNRVLSVNISYIL